MKIFRCLSWLPVFFLLSAPAVFSADYQVPISAFSSFESEAVLASTELDFDREIAIESMKLVHETNGEVPFYFVPAAGGRRQGRLFWLWSRMPHFHEMRYRLLVSKGAWNGRPFGDEALAVKVAGETYLVANHSFEEVEDGKPVGWTMTGGAELGAKNAFRGGNSIRIAGVGSLLSDLVTLKPGTPYRLSFRLLVTGREDTGQALQTVSGQIRYFPESGGQISRMFSHWTVKRPDEEFIGQWVNFFPRSISPDGTAQGRVEVNTINFNGEVFIDNVILEEAPSGQPHRMVIGPLTEIEAAR